MNKKGIALILSFMVIIVLAILSAAVVFRSTSEVNLVKRFTGSTRAFWLAEAGINKAIWKLNDGGGNWTGWTDNGNDSKSLPQVSLGNLGEYDVTISNISTSNPQITSTGYSPSKNAPDEISRTLNVTLKRESIFNYAAFTKISLNISNNAEIDSYNSSIGDYGGSNRGSNGDVGTNGISSPAITIGNNAEVKGDASTGGGTIQIGNNAEVSGTLSYNNNVDLSSVVVPQALQNLSDGGDYNVPNNDSSTISVGDYKYSSINIPNNGQLTINGTVRIYLTGSSSFNISNNAQLIVSPGSSVTFYTEGSFNFSNNATVNNVSKLPKNFLLYSKYTGGLTVSNNGNLYGAIYAPDAAAMTVSDNAVIFGSVVGKTMNISNNAKIHYDEALQSVGGSGRYVISTWSDTQNPYQL